MQLNRMDCSGRSNNAQRDSDLGEDLSRDDQSSEDMHDCDSIDEEHVSRSDRGRLTMSAASNGGDMNYSGGSIVSIGGRSPDIHHQSEIQMSHHHQFPPNHPLNALGSFMGMSGLHGIPNLQHNDVLEKLKMQVRDMKVGLMEQDYAAAHAAAFLPTPINTAFTLPPTTVSSFGQSLAAQSGNLVANGSTNAQNSTNTATAAAASTLTNGGAGGGCSAASGTGVGGGCGAGAGGGGGAGGGNSFSFASPTAPSTKDVNPASNSSTSSEASNSSQQNNGWSFEEQYKQVRQLYEINDDPKRKEFLDDLFSFMQKRGTPINRLPIMAKSVLDLYELYNLVIARGGLVDVINKKLWQEIIKGLHLPSSITSAAFTLRTQYMKYLYPYECEKQNLSSPSELQAAIDGNRREGRRSSYGQYEAMHNQMQLPQMSRQSIPGGMQQMSPLALVTHAAAANSQQAQAAAAAAAAHHRLMAPTFGQVPNLVTHEIEQRMMEYIKLIQAKKEQNAMAAGVGGSGVVVPPHQQQPIPRQRSPSPEITTREALNALEMSRVALWQMYNNNTSPPASVNTSPQGGGGIIVEPQREALNLSESPPSVTLIKRERDRESEPSCEGESCEREDFTHHPPPAKRLLGSGINFPASFYLPPGMAAAAAVANYRHTAPDSDADADADEDPDGDDGELNITVNSNQDDHERQHMNGHHHRQHSSGSVGGGAGGHHDKSDDSAIENSPSTSTSAGNGHMSPVSTKKIHLSKQPQSNCGEANDASHSGVPIGPLETLSLLSGMQFRVARNGTGANGEHQLVVKLELNGIEYSGMLIANAAATAAAANNSNKSNHNSDNHSHSHSRSHMEAMDTTDMASSEVGGTVAAAENNTIGATAKLAATALALAATGSASSNMSNSSATGGMTNGPSSVALKDSLIAS